MHTAPMRRRDFLRRTAMWSATLPLFGLAVETGGELVPGLTG